MQTTIDTSILTSLYGSAAPTMHAAIYWVLTGSLPDDFHYSVDWVEDTDDLSVVIAHAGEYSISVAVWEAGGSRSKIHDDLTSDEKERMIAAILQTDAE